MNQLSTEKRTRIAASLVEENSVRTTFRLTGAAKDTVTQLLVGLGMAWADYHARTVCDLTYERIEVDGI